MTTGKRWRSGDTAVRRVLAAASFGAAAVGVGTLAYDDGHLWDKVVLGAAGVVGLAAVGLSRRSVLAQVFSRGIAWVVLTPMILGVAEALGHGRLPDAHTVFFATTSASALVLARPALHTDAAKVEFGPVAYRRPFLAGAVASVMTGAAAGLFAVEQLAWRPLGHGLALAALATALLASAVGVVRMRSWGVLLGMVTSVAALGAALLSGSALVAVGLALAAIPGALLASPLIAARLRSPTPAGPPEATRVRFAPEVTVEDGLDAAPPVFARIGVAPGIEGHAPAQPARVAVAEK